jgi:hypothetical protein
MLPVHLNRFNASGESGLSSSTLALLNAPGRVAHLLADPDRAVEELLRLEGAAKFASPTALVYHHLGGEHIRPGHLAAGEGFPCCVGEADAHHVQVGAVERVGHLVDAQHALLGRGQRPAALDSPSHRGQWIHQRVPGSVTRRSRDEGIDGVLFDCNAVLGGEYIVQAKRYRKVVPANDVPCARWGPARQTRQPRRLRHAVLV